MERKDDADIKKACTWLVVEGKAPVGRPRKTWRDTLYGDMHRLKVHPWTSATERKEGPWCKANLAVFGTLQVSYRWVTLFGLSISQELPSPLLNYNSFLF